MSAVFWVLVGFSGGVVLSALFALLVIALLAAVLTDGEKAPAAGSQSTPSGLHASHEPPCPLCGRRHPSAPFPGLSPAFQSTACWYDEQGLPTFHA